MRILRLLPPSLIRVSPEYNFSTFAKFLRSLCGQMSESVSQKTEGRCISFCSKLKKHLFSSGQGVHPFDALPKHILCSCKIFEKKEFISNCGSIRLNTLILSSPLTIYLDVTIMKLFKNKKT